MGEEEEPRELFTQRVELRAREHRVTAAWLPARPAELVLLVAYADARGREHVVQHFVDVDNPSLNRGTRSPAALAALADSAPGELCAGAVHDYRPQPLYFPEPAAAPALANGQLARREPGPARAVEHSQSEAVWAPAPADAALAPHAPPLWSGDPAEKARPLHVSKRYDAAAPPPVPPALRRAQASAPSLARLDDAAAAGGSLADLPPVREYLARVGGELVRRADFNQQPGMLVRADGRILHVNLEDVLAGTI